MNLFLIIKIIILKIIRLNLSFIKREISGYPETVKKFEKNFANFIGKDYGITFCNGTSAIEAAIYALGFKHGDEILVPSSNFHSSLGPIKNLNYKPIFVDIDKQSITIDCTDLKKKITNKSKGLLIIHPFGYPCNMDEVLKIVKENNLKLIEDCSHAHGALYDNKKIGSFSDISCFSLQGGKAIAAGEGGISLTNNKKYFLRMSIYGHFNRHENELIDDIDLKKYSKTGISKKLRAHPLGISLATVDFENLKKLNNCKEKIYNKIDQILLKYETVNSIKLNEKSLRGGMFGGYPIIFDDITKLNEIEGSFKKFKIILKPYPWLAHHKMEIYSESKCILPITDKVIDHCHMIIIPQLLNFNFKNLEKCLLECKKNNLIL
tara:strand:+ start:1596 stop:2729 length:1134 start_codon:yes stop_codon:yes gene_type:complete